METEPKWRILFIDDDPSVLIGIRNLLHKDRGRWETSFAKSGEDGLALARDKPFDVVVSDMRMPGMDGATVLHTIRETSPTTVRILLSGQSDATQITRALPHAHQLLGKPCSVASLRAAIERSRVLRLIADTEIRELVGRLGDLPSTADLCTAWTRYVESPTAKLAEARAIIERDPISWARVLQIVNSGYFGHGRVTTELGDALAQLGRDRLVQIALAYKLFEASSATPHDSACGLGGLGATMLESGLGERYTAIVRAAATGNLNELERASLGVTHVEIAASLLELWGVPNEIVESVRSKGSCHVRI